VYLRALSTSVGILSLTLTACGSETKSLRQVNRGGQNQAPLESSECPGGKCSQNEAASPSPGQKPEGETVAKGDGQPAGKLALGFFSGFQSCGAQADRSPDPLTDSFEDIYETVEDAVGENEVSLAIRGCYDTDASRVRFSLSNARKTISSTVPEMIKTLGEELKKIAPVKLHLVGHSYGGWTIMQVAKNLPPEIKIVGLTTIDPISMKDCTAAVYASLILGGGNISGCQRAPADFTDADVKSIRARIDRWTNYYQTNFEFLHSGPIAAAENKKKSYSTPGFEPHSDFLEDESVIQEIVSSVQNSK
jgi:hypothetical protein